jgi:hypothetical protein
MRSFMVNNRGRFEEVDLFNLQYEEEERKSELDLLNSKKYFVQQSNDMEIQYSEILAAKKTRLVTQTQFSNQNRKKINPPYQV